MLSHSLLTFPLPYVQLRFPTFQPVSLALIVLLHASQNWLCLLKAPSDSGDKWRGMSSPFGLLFFRLNKLDGQNDALSVSCDMGSCSQSILVACLQFVGLLP